MGIIIGIDVGISTTKIVGLRDGKPTAPIRITAADPVTSLYGAFGKYLYDNNIALSEVEHVMLTGVGAGYVKNDVYGVATSRCDEFIADALGARYESNIDHAIVISMGTGTSFVMCKGNEMSHVGGIGIGGGTLQGLSRICLGTSDINQISELALQGNLKNVNLLIGDISAQPLPGLPMEATASIFARAKSDTSKEDVAAGIIGMVLQTIGSASVLAAQGTGCRDMVLIGNLTLLPQCKDIFPPLEKLYNVRFHIPKYSEFCTAIGAALAYNTSNVKLK
ncbi:type II pantothenate kinase [Prevotella sp. E13-27]|uniref:type II pantothenate kinase n=1 Tax=Prevotella sp. E13-27 TaxID=2938122 RepID=UPI00200A0FA1|nr:type II pantothenate kinase [Prevotella sp. E13-27]MCK8623522.1 type II pantothenate kinase [Prevotella sp. E13-27]